LVHFQRDIALEGREPPKCVKLHVTADTRYKLYVNNELVSFSPIKGDLCRWFYNEVDIAPYLVSSTNHIRVVVLCFFFATCYTASFPHSPVGGLRIVAADKKPSTRASLVHQLRRGPGWETAVDPFTTLRIDEPKDDFLHTYERVTRNAS
jgi:hypothetical protein